MREQPWLVSLDAQEARVRGLAGNAAAARAHFAVTRRAYAERLRRKFARPWVLAASFAGGFVTREMAGPGRGDSGDDEARRVTLGSVAAAALWVLRVWEMRPRRAASGAHRALKS
jgi:hypothetical protein